jgi:hypothetical protein
MDFAALVAAAKSGDAVAFTQLVNRCAESLGSNRPGVEDVEDDPLHSVREFARLCGGLSPFTVESWLSRGLILRTKCGSRTFIRHSELKKVLREGAKSPAPKRSRPAAAAPVAAPEASVTAGRAKAPRRDKRRRTAASRSAGDAVAVNQNQ